MVLTRDPLIPRLASHRGVSLRAALVTGTPGGARTHDLRIRNPLLYPAELQGCSKRGEIMLAEDALVNPRGTSVSRWIMLTIKTRTRARQERFRYGRLLVTDSSGGVVVLTPLLIRCQRAGRMLIS